jgi:predicted amidohydrolase
VEQWELLVRARAADSTTYVVACDQAPPRGAAALAAPTGVGHSMVVDPFGHVVARLGEEADQLLVDLDLTLVEQAREALPVLRNRRDLSPR